MATVEWKVKEDAKYFATRRFRDDKVNETKCRSFGDLSLCLKGVRETAKQGTQDFIE